jgi:NADPH:quinone reductase-like Zn-dependent oxidoreductase
VLRHRAPFFARREEDDQTEILGAFGALYTSGYPVDWSRLYGSDGRCVSLPPYSWDRERYWLDDLENEGLSTVRRDAAGHPLLGTHTRSSVHRDTHLFDVDLDLATAPYLSHHRLHGQAILPMSVFVEMALAAAATVLGSVEYDIEAFSISRALIIPETGPVRVQLTLASGALGAHTFEVRSLLTDDSAGATDWELHASGILRPRAAGGDLPALDLAARGADGDTEAADACAVEHYALWATRGMEYGETFTSLDAVWTSDETVFGRFRSPNVGLPDFERFTMDPAVLDACLQLPGSLARAAALVPDTDTLLPASIASLRVRARATPEGTAVARLVARPPFGSDPDYVDVDATFVGPDGAVVLEASGVRMQRVAARREVDVDSCLFQMDWAPEELARAEAPASQPGTYVIFADASGVGASLARSLGDGGATCVLVSRGDRFGERGPNDFEANPSRRDEICRVLESIGRSGLPPCRGVVHMWALDSVAPDRTTAASLESDQLTGCFSVAAVVQAIEETKILGPVRLCLVTRGVYDESPTAFVQGSVWGMGRVIGREHPELRCMNVDLAAAAAGDSVRALAESLLRDDPEESLAFFSGVRHVGRIGWFSRSQTRDDERDPEPVDASVDLPFRVEISDLGVLDGLALRTYDPKPLGAYDVEIEVVCAGLNFIDVIKAMGLYQSYEPRTSGARFALGSECAGRVTRVGIGVDWYAPGDEVIAITPSYYDTSLLASLVRVPEHCVVAKPANLTFAQSASVPVAFMTAHYALRTLARLRKGETVLVHAAAGGVGLAALQVARRVGAEVIATAGSTEKRDFVRSLGVEHVFDSRSLDFAGQVLEATGGKGVDVVLNSLAGPYVSAGLSVLAPYGRFVELGKRDFWDDRSVGLKLFRRNISYFAVDLASMAEERPDDTAALFRTVVDELASGVLEPLPVEGFPISAAADAFRHMAQARHIGKIVIDVAGVRVSVSQGNETFSLRPDRTYLITGGLGGIALEVARWMVAHGAGSLVLVGRSDPSQAAAATIGELRDAGATVRVMRADVSRANDVAAVLEIIEAELPPLAGVMHAAGVLEPALVANLDAGQFARVIAPKVLGAWHLHSQTAHLALDYFVLFSSVAVYLPQPGHGNYAAANAFLDALARFRRSRGQTATSVGWGAWKEMGMVRAAGAQASVDEYARGGISAMDVSLALDLFGRALREAPPYVMATPIDFARLAAYFSAGRVPTLFAALVRTEVTSISAPPALSLRGESASPPLVESLREASSAPERLGLLTESLRDELGRVLRIAAARIDPGRPMREQGLDSLMTLEFARRIGANLGMSLPASVALSYPTIEALAAHLVARMNYETGASPKVTAPATSTSY